MSDLTIYAVAVTHDGRPLDAPDLERLLIDALEVEGRRDVKVKAVRIEVA